MLFDTEHIEGRIKRVTYVGCALMERFDGTTAIWWGGVARGVECHSYGRHITRSHVPRAFWHATPGVGSSVSVVAVFGACAASPVAGFVMDVQ